MEGSLPSYEGRIWLHVGTAVTKLMSASTLLKKAAEVTRLIEIVLTTPPGHVLAQDSLGALSTQPKGLTGLVVAVVDVVVVVIKSTITAV